MKPNGMCVVWIWMILAMGVCGSIPVYAQQSETPKTSDSSQGDSGIASVRKLEDVVVSGKSGTPGIDTTPSKTVITVDDFSAIGSTSNIQDLLKTQAIIDFRGETDLVPNSDTMTLRGFGSERFVMAVDGLTLQKTGGRQGSHIVDYSLLSPMPIEKIEIIAGPHSALFDSKGIGGAVNVITKAPKRRDTLVPDVKFSAGYSSYNTQDYTFNMNGAVNIVTYGVGVNKNTTNGYLRNNDTDIETFTGSLGLILPYAGHLNFTASRSDIDRQATVNNDPARSDYDPTYPTVTDSPFNPDQAPTWDKEAWEYRLDYMQHLPVGRLTVSGYNSMEDRSRAYLEYVNKADPSQGTYPAELYTNWRQKGGTVQDEYRWTENHISTIGYDYVKMYDGEDKDERVEKKGLYFQHQWFITPYLDTKLGLRNEDVKIWVSNTGGNSIPNRPAWIERDWNEWVPKSYTTLRMDSMADWLRDTSLSLGVSKIWRAPDNHGDYNPQGRPAGAWLDPEHGMGYDLVLNRRLWGDVSLMVDYSFYQIKNYIASNTAYARYTGAGAGARRFSDYKINLDEVWRHGVEVSLNGHLVPDLSFYLTYAWQKYRSRGDEPAGKTELDDQAEHRVSAGLRYQLFEMTALKLDYYYQGDETMEISEEIGTDGYGDAIYDWRYVDNDAYHLFNVAVEQTLFKNQWGMKDAKVQFYIKNIFDEGYSDARGYPATDRTFGLVFNFRM